MFTEQINQSARHIKAYSVDCIPDCKRADHVIRAGGSVADAIARGFMHFMGQLRHLTIAGSAIATLRLAVGYRKGAKPGCNIHTILAATDFRHVQSAAQALETSPVGQYYSLVPSELPRLPFEGPVAACFVVRKEELLSPGVAPEANPRVPPHRYYVANPFIPRTDNDFLALDRAFAHTKGPCVIDIAHQPQADISSERSFLAAFLARLRDVNYAPHRTERDSPIRPLDRHVSGGQNLVSYWPERAFNEAERDPMVDTVIRLLEDLTKSIHRPHVLFNIRVLAQHEDDARTLAGMVADSAFDEGQYALAPFPAEHTIAAEACKAASDYVLTVPPMHAQLMSGSEQRSYAPLARMASLATHEEIAGAFRLPIGSPRPLGCFTLDTDPSDLKPEGAIVFGHDLDKAADGLLGVERGAGLEVLNCHAVFFGRTGSGKTNAVLGTLIQLGLADVPFLVIEPAKTEYRVLKALKNHPDPKLRSLGRNIRIYTPGDELLSAIRLNPLEIAVGLSRDAKVDHLQSCFEASMTMEGPLQALLPELLDEAYASARRKVGWPTMRDAQECAGKVIGRKHYAPETGRDILAALEVRVGSQTQGVAGRTFQCPISIPSISEIFSGFHIIELNRLSKSGKCLFVFFLLSLIEEHLQTHPQTLAGIRLAMCIEEAHNIVGPDTAAAASEIAANPKAHAAESLARALNEFRAHGIAVLVADQSPDNVAANVVKSAATKFAFCLAETRDREIVGDSMLMNGTQQEHLARLQAGQAYLYTTGYHYPRCIKTPNVTKAYGLPSRLSGAELRAMVETEDWFLEGNQRRCELELMELADALGVLTRNYREILVKTAVLQERALYGASAGGAESATRAVKLETERLRYRLAEEFRRFQRTYYDRMLPTDRDIALCDELTQAAHAELVAEATERVTADIERLDTALVSLKTMLEIQTQGGN